MNKSNIIISTALILAIAGSLVGCKKEVYTSKVAPQQSKIEEKQTSPTESEEPVEVEEPVKEKEPTKIEEPVLNEIAMNTNEEFYDGSTYFAKEPENTEIKYVKQKYDEIDSALYMLDIILENNPEDLKNGELNLFVKDEENSYNYKLKRSDEETVANIAKLEEPIIKVTGKNIKVKEVTSWKYTKWKSERASRVVTLSTILTGDSGRTYKQKFTLYVNYSRDYAGESTYNGLVYDKGIGVQFNREKEIKSAEEIQFDKERTEVKAEEEK